MMPIESELGIFSFDATGQPIKSRGVLEVLSGLKAVECRVAAFHQVRTAANLAALPLLGRGFRMADVRSSVAFPHMPMTAVPPLLPFRR
jgi:hypothetical protein